MQLLRKKKVGLSFFLDISPQNFLLHGVFLALSGGDRFMTHIGEILRAQIVLLLTVEIILLSMFHGSMLLLLPSGPELVYLLKRSGSLLHEAVSTNVICHGGMN
jgi:hypothetical protein